MKCPFLVVEMFCLLLWKILETVILFFPVTIEALYMFDLISNFLSTSSSSC